MSQQPFGDIPLFRELQRLLSSGGGPVNMEIAGQIAAAIASEGGSDPGFDPMLALALEENVRSSETMLSGYTRLSLVEPARTVVVTRAQWAQRTLEGWRWLLDRLAQRFTAEMGPMGGAEESAEPMQQAMGQIAPLMMGMQAGTLVGHLATEALGRYDLPVPREDDGRLFFVLNNIQRIASEYDIDDDAFRRYFAARDAARHLLTRSVEWLDPYFKTVLGDVVDAIEIDMSDLERRLMELQTRGVEALSADDGDDALPFAPTEEHRRALDRVHALVAVMSGYASGAVAVVTERTIEERARIEEVLTRRRATPSQGERFLQQMLGVSLDRALERSGATFCEAVVSLKGIAALNLMWVGPENLPSVTEIKDPFQWMERVLPEA